MDMFDLFTDCDALDPFLPKRVCNYSDSAWESIVLSSLEQPWLYLAEGSRVRAFVSSAEPLVLKLFKTPEALALQYRVWGQNLGEVAWARVPGNEIASAMRMAAHSFQSYCLAARLIPDLAGIVMVHLLPAGPFPSIVVNGNALPLSRVPFLIQQRTELVRDRLLRIVQDGRPSEAFRVIDDVISLILAIWERGTSENTFNFHDNYGYTPRGQLILVDIGELEWECKRLNSSRGSAAALRMLRTKSYGWLCQNFPTLAEYFAAQVRLHLAGWK